MSPGRPDRMLRRPRLLRRLDGRWKVAVLSAPAGFGKTTLAMQFAASRSALWVRLGPEDRDAAHLLGSLLAAGARARPPIGARTRRLFASRRDMERDGALLTASLLAELGARRGSAERVVVIDDLQVLDGAPAACDWLARLVEASDARVRFLFACRGRAPLSLGRFELLDRCVELGMDDLAMTDDEAAAMLRRRFGLRLDASARARLRAVLGGWPAGLVLAAHRIERTADVPPLDPTGDDAAWTRVFSFLAEELLDPLPPESSSAIAKLHLLDELDPAAARALLGANAAERALREVARLDLFVHTPPRGPHARFHPLIREFLRARLERDVAPAERRRLVDRLVRHWLARGEPVRAVRALCDAGALDEARRRFDRLAAQANGEGPVLGPLANELAEALERRGSAAASPWVLLHAGGHARAAGELPRAMRFAREALAAFRTRRRFAAAARAYRLEASLAILAGRWRESLRSGEELWCAMPASERLGRASVAIMLGELWLYAGEPERARAVYDDAAAGLGRRHAVARAELSVRRATLEFVRGGWDRYLALARPALAAFRRGGYLGRAQTLLLNMADASTYLGEEDAALAYLDEARVLAARSGPASESVLEALGRARAHSERRDFDAATRAFGVARERAAALRSTLAAQQIEVWQGVLERRRGRLREADRHLGGAVTALAAMESPAWLAVARMEHALVLGLRRRTDEALQTLAAAARVSRHDGDRKELARNALFEARVRQVAGQRFERPLRRALRTLIDEDYLVLLRKEADVAEPLLAAGGTRASERLVTRALAVLEGAAPGAATRNAFSGRVARRLREPGRADSRAAPGDALELRLLGGFELRVGGRSIPVPRRAARSLIALLALRQGTPMHREAIAETLWPDAPPEASRNRFDVTLNAARRALEPETPARGPFRRLSSEGGLCRLARETRALDLEHFERLAQACEPWLVEPTTGAGARAESRRGLEALADALDAYAGDLLPEMTGAWVERPRDRWRDRHQRLRLVFGRLALAAGRTDEAVDAASRLLSDDPLHEEAEQLLLRALGARGETGALRRSYREFAERLARELDTTPSPETAALADELGAGNAPTSSHGG